MLHWPKVGSPLRYSLILAQNGQDSLIVGQNHRKVFPRTTWHPLTKRWFRKASFSLSFQANPSLVVFLTSMSVVFGNADAEISKKQNLAELLSLDSLAVWISMVDSSQHPGHTVVSYVHTLACTILTRGVLSGFTSWTRWLITIWWAVRYAGPSRCHASPIRLVCDPCHRGFTQGFTEPSAAPGQQGTSCSLGCCTTYFDGVCPPAYSRGICNQYRTYPLGLVPANLGYGQLHVGQQPVCLSVCVSTRSGWMTCSMV